MKTRRIVITGILFLLLLISWLLLILDPITTTFNVAVNTEKIEFITTNKNNSRIILYGADISTFDSEILKDFHGSLELEKGTNVVLERISQGPLVITIYNKTNTIGYFYNEEENGVLTSENLSRIQIKIDSISEKVILGETFIVPLDGTVNLGRTVDYELYGESTALLKDGEVTLTGTSNFNAEYFEAGTKQLSLGDRFIIENPIGRAIGFAVINENSGMQVAYRVNAKSARIIKPGPQDTKTGYIISASLFDRFLNDKLFQGISLFFGGILVLITIMTFLLDIYNFLLTIKKNEHN